MKVAFDEHIAIKMVKGFKAFAVTAGLASRKFKFVSARDYTEKGDPKNDDRPWVRRFHEDGGTIIISGDRQMRSRPHEREALKQCGMIVFFCHGGWSRLQNCDKVAILVRHWPRIYLLCQSSKPGQFWEIPLGWKGRFRDVSGPK